MALHQMTGITWHLEDADLTRLSGDVVLGEPLPVLMAAVLRLRLVSVRDGLATLSATMPQDELSSLRRAMGRVDPAEVPARSRLSGDEDGARLVAVIHRASKAADLAIARILARPA